MACSTSDCRGAVKEPNRNITGLVYRAPELAAKQLELLVEAFPDNKPIAALWEPASAEQFASSRNRAGRPRIDRERPCTHTIRDKGLIPPLTAPLARARDG
jgi:hypothetical protein